MLAAGFTSFTDEFTSYQVLASLCHLQESGSYSSSCFLKHETHDFGFVYRLNLARLVNNGKLPPKTKEAMAIFGVVFIALASLKLLGASRSGPRKLAAYTRFFPSGFVITHQKRSPPFFLIISSNYRIGFAVGFINTPSFSIARLIGGLISLYYTRRHARTSSTPATSSSHLENIPLIIVASGFVLGEGLASIVGLVAKSFGAGPLSCFGCHSGGGGYCGGC